MMAQTSQMTDDVRGMRALMEVVWNQTAVLLQMMAAFDAMVWGYRLLRGHGKDSLKMHEDRYTWAKQYLLGIIPIVSLIQRLASRRAGTEVSCSNVRLVV